ncbi:MAG TPA: DUF1203 domain-containing protein, partial [Kiloniellaceae bacterium]|nr:DUF1203 domain-containing protein [Kiloniellaceae bacterium]
RKLRIAAAAAIGYGRSHRNPEGDSAMARLHFTPIPTETAQSYWAGGTDAHGMLPERHISDGSGVPCRHCLRAVGAGEPYLILAYRPFAAAQPYAEVGPIFLHAEPCEAYGDRERLPAMFANGEPRIVRGYDRDHRIIYGTGKVVPPDEIIAYAERLLSDPKVAYLHARSSQNNCYSCRIERADEASA